MVRRLYSEFEPKDYQIALRPDFDNFTFAGNVLMTGKKVSQVDSNQIRLHAIDMDIYEANLEFKGKVHEASKIELNDETQEAIFTYDVDVPKSEVTLDIYYEAKLATDMLGFYKSTYQEDEAERVVLATQLESHFARRMFPCIDEPEAKASFELIVEIPEGLDAISNMPVAEELDIEGWKRLTFAPTPLMSTYLLSLVVGDMESKSIEQKKKATISVYGLKRNMEKVDFALETAKRCLDFYQDYFKFDYPLPKLDLVGVPEFSAGAMENWGCITFREDALYVDEDTSLRSKQHVALVIAHEIAHQWFGNLVTMRWWDDLWLNEGFASWIEFMCIDYLFPEWEIWNQFVSQDYMEALSIDSLANTHPIVVDVEDPEEIGEIFDTISYKKGASVIRMLHDYLGDKTFRKGMQYYMKKHSYSNTTTHDLWAALGYTSKKPVADFMDAWTTQPGYPVVMSEESGNQLQIAQQRFITSPDERSKLRPSISWPIPITIHGSESTYLLDKPKNVVDISHLEDSWLKLNNSLTGFYRVHYSKKEIKKLTDPIKRRGLPPLDRLDIISDVAELTKAGFTSTSDLLNLLDAYREENNSAVWDVLQTVIMQLYMTFDKEDERKVFEPFGRQIAHQQVARLGWIPKDDEDHMDKIMRPAILALAARLDDQDVIKHAESLLNDEISKKSDIDPDIRPVVYRAATSTGSHRYYQYLLGKLREEHDAQTRNDIATGMCATKDKDLLNNNFQLILNQEVRIHEAPLWLFRMLGNDHAKEMTWKWIKDNWDWMLDNYKNSHLLQHTVKYLGYAFNTEKDAKELESFFSENAPSSIDRSVNQMLETIRISADWRKRDRQKFLNYFSK